MDRNQKCLEARYSRRGSAAIIVFAVIAAIGAVVLFSLYNKHQRRVRHEAHLREVEAAEKAEAQRKAAEAAARAEEEQKKAAEAAARAEEERKEAAARKAAEAAARAEEKRKMAAAREREKLIAEVRQKFADVKKAARKQGGVKRPVPADDSSGFDVAALLCGDAVQKAQRLGVEVPSIAWEITFFTKKGTEMPVGKVAFGEKVTRALFRPVVQKALEDKAEKMTQGRAVVAAKSADAAVKRLESERFKLSWKRTHFLYGQAKMKRTVDGLVYVPRQYKSANREFVRNARQREQYEERDAAHRAEWQAAYNEAVRQEKQEQKDRAAWEKQHKERVAAAAQGTSVQAVTVTPQHVEHVLDEGTFTFAASNP